MTTISLLAIIALLIIAILYLSMRLTMEKNYSNEVDDDNEKLTIENINLIHKLAKLKK